MRDRIWFDELLKDAAEIVINSKNASPSLIQRKLSIGYARASRLMEQLEEIGVISSSYINKPRKILIKSIDEINIFNDYKKNNEDVETLKNRIEWLEENVVSLEKKVFSKEKYKKDELYNLAKDYTYSRVRVSPAIFQRVFSINYNKASEIIDRLEKEGIISKRNRAKPRIVKKSKVNK